MLEIGTKAPAFKTVDQDGQPVSLSDFLGKKVILYFYPKDDTPGCTKESCAFRDDYQKFKSHNVEILGVGVGDQKSHKKFVDKYSLPFRLLVDDDHEIATNYNAWGEKSMYGRTYLGISRITYIIDEKSNILQSYPKVSPTEHVAEILTFLSSHP